MKLQQLSDQDLVKRFIQGDQTSIEVLINRHKNKVYTYIILIVKNQSLAEDIFQDTFIKVIKSLKEGKYKDNGKFVSWVIRIAHNLTIDHFRKEKQINTYSNEDYEADIFNSRKLCVSAPLRDNFIFLSSNHGAGFGTDRDTRYASGDSLFFQARNKFFSIRHFGIGRSQGRHKSPMNLCSRYGFAGKLQIAGGTGICHDRASETKIRCRPGRGIYAHMAHGATDDHLIDFCAFELIQKPGFPETVWIMFLYDGLFRKRVDAFVDFNTVGAGQEK